MRSSSVNTNNPLYQVDCTIGSSGKKIAITKRRIRWRWGIANKDAIQAGSSGVECRGYEHEVTLVWSITSGKRLVVQDEKEIHFSQGRRTEGRFQFAWTGPGQHHFTIIAHAAPPMKASSSFKQFELLVDGKAFSDLPRIFELGQSTHRDNVAMPVVSDRDCLSPLSPNSTKSINEDELRWAQTVCRMEQKRDMNQPIAQVSPSTITTTTSSMDFLSDVDPTTDCNQDLLSVPSPHYQDPTQTFAPIDNTDAFNPNQPPSYDAIWSSIMDAYDMNDAIPTTTTTTSVPSSNDDTTMARETQMTTPVPTVEKSISKTDLSSDNARCESPQGVASLDGAMDNLVNLDDLLSPVMSMKLTMNPDDKENMSNKSNTSKKSQGMPSKAASLRLGRQLSLKELKNIQTNGNVNTSMEGKKEIMKANAVPVQEGQSQGALVVYGQQPQHQYGDSLGHVPPPLPRVNGFGLGAVVTYSYR